MFEKLQIDTSAPPSVAYGPRGGTPSEETDEQLVARLRRGRACRLDAFETLVARHRSSVLAGCRVQTGDWHDAEDLAQEVFVKAFYGLERFEGRSSFKTWLHKIRVHHCLNHEAKARRQRMFETDIGHEQLENGLQDPSCPERSAIADAERKRLLVSLGRLPEGLRLALALRELHELSYKEIAESLGVGVSAAKMRVKRAREALRLLHPSGPASRESCAA